MAPSSKSSFITGVSIAIMVVCEVHASDQVVMRVSDQVDSLCWQFSVMCSQALFLMLNNHHAAFFKALIVFLRHTANGIGAAMGFR